MKFTHVVVKEGNGKPSDKQIEDAAMVKKLLSKMTPKRPF